MTEMTLQIHHDGRWHDCAQVSFSHPQKGIAAPCQISYDINYFSNYAAIDAMDGLVIDNRALSVNLPVNIDIISSERWLPFLLDIIPQGAMRRRLASQNNYRLDDPRLDFMLLNEGTGNPIGNIRIKESFEKDADAFFQFKINGVTWNDIKTMSGKFLELWEYSGLISGGSDGIQGDWPKIMMTQKSDGLWYPDAMIHDDDACKHVIVKRSHPHARESKLILQAEKPYLELARAFGLKVGECLTIHDEALIIPRFDRDVKDGKVVRIGQESLASVMLCNDFGISLNHIDCIMRLKEISSSPMEDVIEYVLRDVLNLATGNTDTHGRNTAIAKYADGTIRLTPFYDYAPMCLIQEGPRPIRYSPAILDHCPNWNDVADAVCDSEEDKNRLLAILCEKADFIKNIKHHAITAGVDPDIVNVAMKNHLAIADSMSSLCNQKVTLK